jgi:hypothetical protein
MDQGVLAAVAELGYDRPAGGPLAFRSKALINAAGVIERTSGGFLMSSLSRSAGLTHLN